MNVNPSLVAFGGGIHVASFPPAVDDTAREGADELAAREPERDGEYEVADDTQTFIETETAVYLTLPIPAVFIKMWRWFDRLVGVRYGSQS